MAGRKDQPTKVDLAERIELTRRLIGRCCTKSMIKAEIRKVYKGLAARTIEGYLARAREAILADAGRGRQKMRTEQSEFYRAMMAEGDTDTAKIRAAERFDRLHGLERPAASTVNVTGTGEGGAVKVESKVKHDERIAIDPSALAAFVADVAAIGNRDIPADGHA